MELCITQPISIITTNPTHLRPKPALNIKLKLNRTQIALHSRSLNLANWVPKAAMSEETSSGPNKFFAEEQRNGAVAVEDSPSLEKKVYIESGQTEVPKVESPDVVDDQFSDLFANFNIKFDSEDTYSILLYGGSALGALWLTSAVVSAIDAIPLFPKLMEVVGLGYALWFTTRYLVFKENRDELAAKVEELKQQILGSKDD